MSTVTRHLEAIVVPDHRLRAVFSWDSKDPFAVVMDVHFKFGVAPARWEFALAMLESGLRAPVVSLDIVIYPATGGRTHILLCPPGPPPAVLQLDSSGIAGFLADTFTVDAPPIPDYPADIDWGEVSEL